MMEGKDEKFLFKIKIFILIIEVIVCGLIAFVFFGVSKVNAQGYNMTNWNVRDANDNWYSYANGTTQDVSLINAIGFNFNGTTGNNNGVVYVEGDALGQVATNDISISWWTSPANNGTGAVSKNCVISKTSTLLWHVKCQFNFTITNNSDNIAILMNLANARNFYSLTVSGYTDVQPNNNATTQDIINQTIQITNQIVESVRNSIQNVEDQSDNIIYQISHAIENAAESILNTSTYCEIFDSSDIKEDGKYLSYYNNGEVRNNSSYGITDYINIYKGKITIDNVYTTQDGTALCYYKKDKTLINCILETDLTTNITIPDGAYYMRFTIQKRINEPKITLCKSDIQAMIDNQNSNTDRIIENNNYWGNYLQENWEDEETLLTGILDSINQLFSSSVDDPSDSLNNLNGNLDENNAITSLLLLPVSIFQKVINSINGTCQSFNLGELLGHDLVMPCISISNIIGSSLYGVIDVILSGFLIYHIRNKLVKIWENLTSLKTGGNELE